MIYVQDDYAIHNIAKNTFCEFITIELWKQGLKGQGTTTGVGKVMSRARDYEHDFMKPHISIIDFAKFTRGANGMLLGTPELVVEVLGNNREKDLDLKKRIYAEIGGHEYWIVDLDASSITRLILKDGEYSDEKIIYNDGGSIRHSCRLELNVGEVFTEIDKIMNSMKSVAKDFEEVE